MLLAKSAKADEKLAVTNRRVLLGERGRVPKLLPVNDEGTIDLSPASELQTSPTMDCDVAFFDCLRSDECNECFNEMKTKDIDWAGVTQNTQCATIISTLQSSGSCTTLGPSKNAAQDIFCQTFHACVIFDDSTNDDATPIDCGALTECDWHGIHKSFVGDGVCHDKYFNACYNTAICGYDGGDCCKDTCKDAYLRCGSDDYTCRDPKSSECDPTLTLNCPPSSYKKTSDDTGTVPACDKSEALYRLVMYDSFGDGWEQTEITITPTAQPTNSTPVYKGGLKDGAEGTVYICLSLNSACYHVDVSGGNWGREASWYVRGSSEGSPAVASGGGAMKCDFSVAGGTCDNTCTGKSNLDPSKDTDYRDFKTMVKCIDEKCMLQSTACRSDKSCMKCFNEDVPDYCFSIDTFLAVTDCAMCKCSDMNDSSFCNEKQGPGIIIPTPKNGGKEMAPLQCTPAETLAGSAALLNFSQCMDYDKNPIMMTKFDSNNFGDLDTFEACAHAFRNKTDRGGHTALGCLQILVDAIDEKEKDGEPTEVISQLANLLYRNGESFCDCAKTASTDCPLCPSFYNFKTLLYESLDACSALDDIDCDAWNEFQEPCKVNLMAKFGSVDFTKKDQCDFTQGTCGSVGPFPSFRRLDCANDIPVTSWDFYNQYEQFCLSADRTSAPALAPALPPQTQPDQKRKNTMPPTPYQPVKPSVRPNDGKPVPYNPDNSSGKRPSYKSPDEKKKKSHWFRNLFLIAMLCGIAYFVYKKQSDGFSFVRYRRMTNFGAGDGSFGMSDNDMFSGLALESSTNFEPPSLPPTPMSMPSNGGYGA